MVAESKSKGQYLHKAKELCVETRDLAPLLPNEVQVAIRATTLCGSDLHYYQHFCNGDILVREPLCLGHESAGEVTAVGDEVSTLSVGDNVALEVGIPCTECPACKSGRYNICPKLRFRSSGSKFPHYQGTLQQYLNHPAKWVYKLPSQLNYEIGALLEPLSVAIQAVRRFEQICEATAKCSCLIFGAGAVGLLVSVAARAAGWKHIVMADIDEGRLRFAKENNFADTTFAVKLCRGADLKDKLAIAKETASELATHTWPDGSLVEKPHVTFECTGVESCLQASIYATVSGGTVLILGLGVPNHTLPISEATAREIAMIPIWRYANTYPKAIEIAAASVAGEAPHGKKLPDIRKLVTHRFHGLDSVEDAFQTAGKTKDADGALVIKTVIET